MGWSIGWDNQWGRWIGYGVPAYSDHPESSEKIDRGLAYVCGGEPYGGEHGCGLHFGYEHLMYVTDKDGNRSPQLCPRCAENWGVNDIDTPFVMPFTPKDEHPDWIKHVLTDPSWKEWLETSDGKAFKRRYQQDDK